MKKNAPEFSQRYVAALRAHLGCSGTDGKSAAALLGRDALTAGLDALDLARLHEDALVALASSHDFTGARNGQLRRTGNFLGQVLVPVARHQRATHTSLRQLQQRTATLRQQAAVLTGNNRQLRREVAQRAGGIEALRQAKERYQRLFLHSQLMQKKLRRLTRQILSAQEDERREISRELHDEVVQTLVGINVQLSALGSAATLGIRGLKAKIAHTQRLVERSVNSVHQFARELRPAVLDDLGLIPALLAHIKTIAALKKLKIRLTAVARVEVLEKSKRTVLYRVAQEALTNIVRHAEATVVTIHISEIPKGFCLEVQDNGKSFPVAQTLSARNKRLGLIGMRERVEMVGGVWTIESAAGRGTTVRAEIPCGRGGAR